MIKQVIDYLKSEARKTMVLSISGAIITLCGFAWNYVVNRLNAMQQTINESVIIPTPNIGIKHYSVINAMYNHLLSCKQTGVFMGWILIKTIYDTPNGKCKDTSSCPVLKYSVYYENLYGIWGDINHVEDTKLSNPYYERTDLVLDNKTRTFFFDTNRYQNGILHLNQQLAITNHLAFIEDLYSNLNLRQNGLTLEAIYIKPVFYEKDLIMAFTLSFQQIPLKNGNCYDKGMQAQSVILNKMAELVKTQYNIY